MITDKLIQAFKAIFTPLRQQKLVKAVQEHRLVHSNFDRTIGGVECLCPLSIIYGPDRAEELAERSGNTRHKIFVDEFDRVCVLLARNTPLPLTESPSADRNRAIAELVITQLLATVGVVIPQEEARA